MSDLTSVIAAPNLSVIREALVLLTMVQVLYYAIDAYEGTNPWSIGSQSIVRKYGS